MPDPDLIAEEIADDLQTALDQFLQETDRFEVDRQLENKLLFTCNPGGYLRRRKD